VLASSCCRGGPKQDGIHYHQRALPVQDDAIQALWSTCNIPEDDTVDEVIWGMNQLMGAYLDDLIVFSATWDDHLAHVRAVLNRLSEVGLTTKPSKCQLAMEECTNLGQVIGNGVVKPETAKLQEQFPLPTTKK